MLNEIFKSQIDNHLAAQIWLNNRTIDHRGLFPLFYLQLVKLKLAGNYLANYDVQTYKEVLL